MPPGVLLHRRTGGANPLAGLPAPTAFWRMEEAAGAARVDSVGSVNLTDQGSTPQTTGYIGHGAGSSFSNANYLRNTTTGLGTSGTWELGFWLNLASIGTLQTVWYAGGSVLRIGSTSPNGIPRHIGTSNLDWGAALSTSTWYAISLGYDGANSFLVVNAGTPVTVASTSVPGTDFSFGDQQGAGNATQGNLDAVAYWKGTVLTTGQRTLWYNGAAGSGAGTEYFGGQWH